MVRLIYFLLIQTFCITSLQATTEPVINFIKSYGGNHGGGIACMRFAKDGNIIYALKSSSSTHDLSCNPDSGVVGWLLKTDRSGNEIFSTCYGGGVVIDTLGIDTLDRIVEFFTAMQATRDSGCIVACYNDFATLYNPPFSIPTQCEDSLTGYLELSLVKFDKNGNVQWSQCYGSGEDDGIFGLDTTSDGGYVFLAQVERAGGQVYTHYGADLVSDCWIVKTDSVGNIQWDRVLGGTSFDYACTVKEINSGKYMTSIWTASRDSMLLNLPHYSEYDAWFCVFDSSGSIVHQGTVPWYGASMQPNDFITMSDGGLIWAGAVLQPQSNNSCNLNTGYNEFAIFRLDSIFNIDWCLIEGGDDDNYLYSIAQLNANTYIACGESDSKDYNADCVMPNDSPGGAGWIICFDSQGQILWKQCIAGTSPRGTGLNNCIADTATGQIFATGTTLQYGGDFTNVITYTDSNYPSVFLVSLEQVNGIISITPNIDVRAYPDPASDQVEIDIRDSEAENISLLLTDLTGQIVGRLSLHYGGNAISLSGLTSGLYLASVYSNNLFITTKKIVKM